jgi:hypothetical protein
LWICKKRTGGGGGEGGENREEKGIAGEVREEGDLQRRLWGVIFSGDEH